MSDAKSPSDLSMDEILATIRRIIAEDEQSSASTAGAGAHTGSSAPAPAPASAAAKEPPRDEVLELTDALNADGSVRRLAPIGSSSGSGAGSPEPTPPAAAIEPEPPSAPRVEFEPPMAPRVEPEAAPSAARVEPEPERREPTVPISGGPASGSEERLVSEVTSLAAAAAFARLAAAPRSRGEPPRVGDQTLEEIVRDLLRPLLRTWLDDNLPQIAERLVEAELARIGRSRSAE